MLYLKNSYSQEHARMLNEGDDYPSFHPQLLIPFWQKHIGKSTGNPARALVLDDPSGKLGLLAHLWGFEVVRLQGIDEAFWPENFPNELEAICFDVILSHEYSQPFQRNQHFFLDRLHHGGSVLLLGSRLLSHAKFPGKPDLEVNRLNFGYTTESLFMKQRPKLAQALDRLIHPFLPSATGRHCAVAIRKLHKNQKTVTR